MQRVIGLMSGTSADEVDAALVEFQEDSLRLQVCVLAHATYLYDTALRAQILAASYPESGSLDLICHLNVALGKCFAAAAMAAGDLGAPLALYVHHLLFADPHCDRHGLLAFDTGPGNMLSDEALRHFSGG